MAYGDRATRANENNPQPPPPSKITSKKRSIEFPCPHLIREEQAGLVFATFAISSSLRNMIELTKTAV